MVGMVRGRGVATSSITTAVTRFYRGADANAFQCIVRIVS
jgi:hypothetical protein